MKTQKKVIEHMKENKYNTLYSILIVIDDVADTPEFTRQSTLLHQLYIRGRHQMISTITATQVFKAGVTPIIRKNITDLYIYRLRHQADLDGIVEEVSAIYDKKTILKMYQFATSEPYSFLYIRLTAKDANEMFYLRLDRAISPNEL